MVYHTMTKAGLEIHQGLCLYWIAAASWDAVGVFVPFLGGLRASFPRGQLEMVFVVGDVRHRRYLALPARQPIRLSVEAVGLGPYAIISFIPSGET